MKLFTINRDVLFYENYKQQVDTSIIFKDIKYSWLKALRMLHLKSKLPLFSIWFTREFRCVGTTETEIILFDTVLTVPAANYIKRKYPNLRVIYWYWNHIYNSALFEDVLPNIEKWSYDKVDCKRYEMMYNTQFHFKEVLRSVEEDSIKRDFFFIGAEKGRAQYIEECKRVIDANNLSREFVVIGNSRQDRAKYWMPYAQVIENLKQSRCVVDLVPETQKGLTLRPLEALFLKKKLITNLKEIVNYDFYCSDNVFILGVDNESDLPEFLDADYNHKADMYIELYDFKTWLKRFTYK